VAGFVGAGKTLRRLDLLQAADALVPARTDAGGPSIGPTATLADAMGALLTGDGPAVRVVDGGTVVGEITLDSLRAALRDPQADAGVEADVEVET
jgi:CBS domain-containing protein